MQDVKKPTQKRGQETFRQILHAAAQILASDGLPGLNTNRVAEVAGVTPPTIYRYFNDKVDILAGLSERFVEEEARWLSTSFAALKGNFSATSWIAALVSGYWTHAQTFVGLPELRRAMKSFEPLYEYEEQSLLKSTDFISQILADRFGYASADAAITARFLVETTCSTVDRCYDLEPSETQVRLTELQKMLVRYISAS